MKNKIRLKRFLTIISVISMCFAVLLMALNMLEYKIYTNNFNNKLDLIIGEVRQKYPEVSSNDIMQILNNKEKSNNVHLFEEYGIDMEKDSMIIENERNYYVFQIGSVIIIMLFGLILAGVFVCYDSKKAKEIHKITTCIEEINRKNYKLDIDDISEDELSVLKNEIYKATIMLKESAENSIADKVELKKSLEDISHQLKTPLTSILIILDNLIDEPDMECEIREDFIRDIKREVTCINFLIQSILKLSKFDSNTIHFIKSSRLIKDVVDESIKNVSVLSDLKNVSIVVDGDVGAMINCDYMWEVEAITNIIKNCVEHSSSGARIEIGYEQSNVYSSIVIRDFAGGIDKEDLPHIFERFYKGKNASGDSVGIGLALAKKIIENDNGCIGVESDSEGSRFVVRYFSV